MREVIEEMLTCEQADELMEPAVDDELSEEDRFRFQAHLARCPACAEELERARQLEDDLVQMFEMKKAAQGAEESAVSASVEAFNRVESKRHGTPAVSRNRGNRKTRTVAILLGWAGALVVGIRAIVYAAQNPPVEPIAPETPALNQALNYASGFFSTTPVYLLVGAAMLLASLTLAIKIAVQRD